MEYATMSIVWAPTMKGIRHVNLSASKAETSALMAPTAYGGAVISWALCLSVSWTFNVCRILTAWT